MNYRVKPGMTTKAATKNLEKKEVEENYKQFV